MKIEHTYSLPYGQERREDRAACVTAIPRNSIAARQLTSHRFVWLGTSQFRPSPSQASPPQKLHNQRSRRVYANRIKPAYFASSKPCTVMHQFASSRGILAKSIVCPPCEPKPEPVCEAMGRAIRDERRAPVAFARQAGLLTRALKISLRSVSAGRQAATFWRYSRPPLTSATNLL